MGGNCAFIVIDSGFEQEALHRAHRVVGVWDLTCDLRMESDYNLSRHELDRSAGDPMKHGSEVLHRMLALVPDAPVVLITAFHDDRHVYRTGWSDGNINRPGWTEAYLWAVNLCKRNQLASVANCSFGTLTHAMDGGGWESSQLAQVTGPGKSGHVMIAGIGVGDGRAGHASFLLQPGESKSFYAGQEKNSEYNLWLGLGENHNFHCGYHVDVYHNGHQILYTNSNDLPRNMWNYRAQLMVRTNGGGIVEIKISRWDDPRCDDDFCAMKVDCWTEDGRFHNYIDPVLLYEPGIFPHVIGVGLRAQQYCPTQYDLSSKPDVMVPGPGLISFRLPEVAAAANVILSKDPTLDSDGVKKALGKYPDISKFI